MTSEDIVLFDNALIKEFHKWMFDTLLYVNNMTHSTPRLFEYLEDIKENPEVPEPRTRGYILVKGNTKYLLPQKDSQDRYNLDKLPIRVGETDELILSNKDVVHYVYDEEYGMKKFRIKPDKKMTFLDTIQCDGIVSQDPDTWLLLKVIRNVAYCRRINIVVSGIRSSGKTSAFTGLGWLTNKGYVVKAPKSVKGLSYGLRQDGYVVLDEIGSLNSESRETVGSYLYQQGERAIDFKTGKGDSAAHNLFHSYDIHQQSCVVVTNLFEDYLMKDEETGELDVKNKDKFFHYMFSNSQAINDRFLPLRITPIDTPLTREERRKLQRYIPIQQFTSTIPPLTDEVVSKYYDLIKTMEHFTVNWDEEVDYEFVDREAEKNDKVKARHYPSYKEILAGIYLLTKDMGATDNLFDYYRNIIDRWIADYYGALKKFSQETNSHEQVNNGNNSQKTVQEEWIK